MAFEFSAQVEEPKQHFNFGTFFTTVVLQKEDPWTPAQAFLCVLQAAAECDGSTSPDEINEILATLHRSRIFKEAGPEQTRQASKVVAERLSKRGHRALTEACAALKEQYALPVFAHAVDIVLADGGFVQAEADFLNELMRLLGINSTQAQQIAEVMNIKNGC